MACSIIRNKETSDIEKVLAPNGKESILYKDILAVQPNAEKALRYWAQPYTETFKDKYGYWEVIDTDLEKDSNGEPSIKYIVGLDTKVDETNPIFSEADQKVDIGNTAAVALANQLATSFGISYSVINAQDARNLTKDTTNPWTGEAAFFFSGKVYLLEGRFTADNVLHEYAHPLAASIFIENPTLFNKIYSDLSATVEGESIISDVRNLYPDLEDTSAQFRQEVLVRALAANNSAEQTSKGFKDFINKLLFAFKQMLRKAFGIAVKVENLSANTSLSQLANMLRSDKFDINTQVISQQDYVDYVRDITNFTNELDNVEYLAISETVQRFYDVVTNHIRRIKENKNYSEAKKFLVDETGRGQLQELKSTLENTEINEELEKIFDKLVIRQKTTQNFVHSILRLDKMAVSISSHIDQLAAQGQSKDVISNLFYYDLLLRNWSNFIDETNNRLAANGLPTNSEFGRLVAGLKYTIDTTTKKVHKIYANNVDGVLFESLTPLVEGINRHFSDEIERLKAISGSEQKIKDMQQKWDSMRLTKKKINDLITGRAGDTNAYSAFLESYTNSPDPVIGGFAMFLKNAYNDVDSQTQVNMNDFIREMEPLLKAAGYNRSNYTELMKSLVTVEKVPFLNEKGEFETKDVWSFIDKFKDTSLETSRLKHEYDSALQKGDEVLADQILKDLRKHRRDYFHQEYVNEYYEREKIYESELGKEAYKRKQTIINAVKELDGQNYDENFYDEVSEQKKLLWRQYSQLASLTDAEGNPKTGEELEIAKIERQYRKESREFFEWVPTPGLFESNLRRMEQALVDDKIAVGSPEFLEARNKWIKNNTVVAYTQKFFDERNKVLSDLRTFMESLPQQTRDMIDSSTEMEEMLDMATGFRDQDGQIIGTDITQKSKDKAKTLQEKINEKRKTLYSGLSKAETEELSDLFNKKDQSINSRLSPEDSARMTELVNKGIKIKLNVMQKGELNRIYQKLSELQSKEATDYYVDIANSWMEKLELPLLDNETVQRLLQPDSYVTLFNESSEYETWFKANHVSKEVFDAELGTTKTVYERIFIWNRTRPNDPESFETITLADGEKILGKPNLSYFYRSVKKDYRTKKEVGITVDNKGSWLPKTVAEGAVDDKYMNPAYDKLRRERPAAFAALEKFKEFHLKFQEGLPRESRLYLQIPRYRKPRLEYLQGTSTDKEASKAKEWMRGVKQMFFKANDDYQDGLNFNPEQLVYTNMFDEEIKKVPITGLYNLELDQVSMNIGDSMLKYMHSGLRQKKLVELNPFAQALKTSIADPDNAVKDMSKINKWMFQKTGRVSYLTKKGESVRASAIQRLYEREFEGVNQAGWFANSPALLKFQSQVMSLASFGFFSFNVLPSALKNRMGAVVQLSIEAAGSKYINYQSYLLGKPRALKMILAHSAQLYKTGNRSLDAQLIQVFDPGQGMFDKTLGEQFGRSFASDTASLSFFMSPRKFLEVEATLEMFSGMMHHIKVEQTLNGQTKKIRYIDAWEVVNGQITLKEGIDKKYNLGGEEFNRIKNTMHEVSNRLQGTYSRMDQPEAQRYAAFRLVAFLKKFFTSMLMNRVGATRPSAALGTVTTGYYTSVLKTAKDFFKYGVGNYNMMSLDEKRNFLKFVSDIAHQVVLFSMLGLVFGYDGDDEERFEKMRKRSGALNEDDYNFQGWLFNHGIVVMLGTLNETQQFSSWSQVKATGRNIIMPDAIYGVTLKQPMDFLDHLVGYMTDDKGAFYKKDAGPYSFQKQDSPKFINDAAKIFGITGSQIDPVKALKGQEFQRRK